MEAGWCLAMRKSRSEVDRPSLQAVAWAVGSAGSISDDGWYRTGSMTLDLVRESHSKADHPHDPKRPSRLCGTAPLPSSHDRLPSPLAFNPATALFPNHTRIRIKPEGLGYHSLGLARYVPTPG